VLDGNNARSRDSAVAGRDSALLAVYSGPPSLRRMFNKILTNAYNSLFLPIYFVFFSGEVG